MEDLDVSAPTPEVAEIEPIVRQTSAGGFFDSPAQPVTGDLHNQPFQKCQKICGPQPSVLQLQSLLGPPIPIPISSVTSVADLQTVATGIYDVPIAYQRLFLGPLELPHTMSIAELVQLGTTSTPSDGISVRVILTLPAAADSDYTLGAFRVLPPELVVFILSLLSLSDVASVSRSCKRLREVSSDCNLWWALFSRYWCPYTGAPKMSSCWKVTMSDHVR